MNAVCFEAIIVTGPRQSGFLTIIDKPQPDGARNGQARNPKIDVYADGTPRTATGPASNSGWFLGFGKFLSFRGSCLGQLAAVSASSGNSLVD